MNAADYDAWYDTPRGCWIGETEYRLLLRQLDPQPGERLLDVGCGTGWFTRRLARQPTLDVTGIDIDTAALVFARSRDCHSTYLHADALRLPFADASFERVISVTALCFIADWQGAIGEIVRVCRKRFAIGLLNRHSLLWRPKGRDGGVGAYRGAHWHTAREVRHVLDALPVDRASTRSAIFLPSGSGVARRVEQWLPETFPYGSFLLVCADKRQDDDRYGSETNRTRLIRKSTGTAAMPLSIAQATRIQSLGIDLTGGIAPAPRTARLERQM